MYRYKHLVVGVSLGDGDSTLVDYAELVSFMARSERVRFVHVRPAAFALGEPYPEFALPTEEIESEVRERLTALVDGFRGPKETEVGREIVEGAALPELLRVARDEDADLVVVGKDEDGGTLAEKLARKAPCSVLIVPDEVPARIERVLVPVDFSDHAADAVDVAVAFAEAAELSEVHVLHVYCVPTSYLKLGKTYEEAREAWRRHSRERAEAFVDGLDLRGLRPVVHLAEGRDTARTICETAESLRADLVMIGTRGRSDAAAVLMGSVAEKTVRGACVPTVAVKRKGSTLSLIDALLEL